jgi:peptide-methionine (S)-S-oxide reductase
MKKELSIAVFGGGCFWCTEAVFSMLRGVESVMSGYAGGHVVNPTYEQVSAGSSGHAEVIRISYDLNEVSYDDLLTVFFATHDPTTKNRQGNDVGPQYRSIVLYQNDAQRDRVLAFIGTLEEELGAGKVVTEVESLGDFYEAEEYHRDYYKRNSGQPYCQVVINPKLHKVRKQFARLLRENESGS